MNPRLALSLLVTSSCFACLDVVPLSQLPSGTPDAWALANVVKARQIETSGRFGADVALTAANLYVGAPGSSDCGGALEETSCEGGVLNIWRRPLQTSATPTLLGPADSEVFGFASTFAVDEGELWVGAPGRRTGTSSGAVARFRRSTGRWSEPEVLQTGAARLADNLGYRVALARPYAAVFAPGAPCPADDTLRGVLQVFHEDVEGWRRLSPVCVPQGPRAANDLDKDTAGDVAISGDLLALGLPWAAPGTNQGRVEVYRLASDSVRRTQTLTTDTLEIDPQNKLGIAVAVVGEEIIVGASGDGEVYVFDARDGGLVQELSAPEGRAGRFGAALAVSEGWLAIGAPDDPNCATGTDPREWLEACVRPRGNGPGAVFLFARDPSGRWRQRHYIKPPWPGAWRFGAALALLDDVLAVGAPFDGSVGVGVDQPWDPGPEEIGEGGGAVFLFQEMN